MSFSNQKSHYSIREFLKHIEQNILLNHEIDIDGNYKITDPMIIANFLYRIRFIIAKNVSNGTYYNFDERPSLLENKDNKNYSLDIPSCFEQYLNLE
jgi:hypothetical protein